MVRRRSRPREGRPMDCRSSTRRHRTGWRRASTVRHCAAGATTATRRGWRRGMDRTPGGATGSARTRSVLQWQRETVMSSRGCSPCRRCSGERGVTIQALVAFTPVAGRLQRCAWPHAPGTRRTNLLHTPCSRCRRACMHQDLPADVARTAP